MSFPERLAQRMTALKVSQNELAETVGVSQGLVSRWARGVNTPDVYQGLAIAKALRISLDELVDDDYSATPPLTNLAEDEASILRFYRGMKQKGCLNESTALLGMSTHVDMPRRDLRHKHPSFGVDFEAIAQINIDDYLNAGVLTISFDDGTELTIIGEVADRFMLEIGTLKTEQIANPTLAKLKHLKEHLAKLRMDRQSEH